MKTNPDRVWKHYQALREVAARNGFGPNWKWLQLARTHRMPVRSVKDLIAARKQENAS